MHGKKKLRHFVDLVPCVDPAMGDGIANCMRPLCVITIYMITHVQVQCNGITIGQEIEIQ